MRRKRPPSEATREKVRREIQAAIGQLAAEIRLAHRAPIHQGWYCVTRGDPYDPDFEVRLFDALGVSKGVVPKSRMRVVRS